MFFSIIISTFILIFTSTLHVLYLLIISYLFYTVIASTQTDYYGIYGTRTSRRESREQLFLIGRRVRFASQIQSLSSVISLSAQNARWNF